MSKGDTGLDVGRGPIKQRFEVHVCTTAERGYALEAWRQLDPHARLIPVASRPTRIVCVPSKLKKQLSRVLGLGQPPPPAAAMPLAIIVDDRLEVLDHFIPLEDLFIIYLLCLLLMSNFGAVAYINTDAVTVIFIFMETEVLECLFSIVRPAVFR
jgi:hypothetical protein